MTIAQYLEELKHASASQATLTNALLSIKWLHNFMPGLNPHLDPANDIFLTRIVESQKRNTIQKTVHPRNDKRYSETTAI